MEPNENRIVDEFLVMQCQDGDRKALSALVNKWQPPFLRYASLVTRDPDMAADILQEAWIKIIRALPSLRDPIRFNTWAYRIINNQCMDTLRKVRPSADDAPEPVFKPMNALEAKEQVWAILAELSTQHRCVLALHYLQGFDVAEISKIVRIPEGTVKSRLHHAREKFRSLLEQQENPQPTNDGEQHGQAGQPDFGSAGIRYRPT